MLTKRLSMQQPVPQKLITLRHGEYRHAEGGCL